MISGDYPPSRNDSVYRKRKSKGFALTNITYLEEKIKISGYRILISGICLIKIGYARLCHPAGAPAS